MRKSEIYRQRAQESDNVFAALGLHTKALREERKERFEETWLPKLLEKEVIVTHFAIPQNKYEICFIENGTEKIIDYFPKANKVLVRSQNKWIKPGLKWIVQKFKL
jgi:hypothetical protein